MNKIIPVAVLLAGCAHAASAQGSRVRPTPTAGELIRVTPDSGAPFTGRLAALGGDTLVLSPSDRDSAVTAVVSRERVEVSRSRRERWSGLGALAGITAGLLASQLQSGGSESDAGTKKARVAVVGGAAGGVLGGFLGFALAPHRWQLLHAGGPHRAPALAAPATLPPPPGPPPASAATGDPPAPAATGSTAAPATASTPAPGTQPERH